MEDSSLPAGHSTQEPLRWDPSLEIGDPRIDTQHRHLFKLVSRAMELREGPDRRELQDLLFKLYAYVDYHFSDEEVLMQERGYPKLAEHRAMHQQIIRSLNQVLESSSSIREVADRVFAIVSDWVLEHIRKVDTELALFRKQGPAEPSRVRQQGQR